MWRLVDRNYHVFYYLLAGCSETEKATLLLKRPQDYFYLNQVACLCALHCRCVVFSSVVHCVVSNLLPWPRSITFSRSCCSWSQVNQVTSSPSCLQLATSSYSWNCVLSNYFFQAFMLSHNMFKVCQLLLLNWVLKTPVHSRCVQHQFIWLSGCPWNLEYLSQTLYFECIYLCLHSILQHPALSCPYTCLGCSIVNTGNVC